MTNKNEEKEKRDISSLDIAAEFEDELKLLQETQKEVEELYDDIHDHYLRVRQSKGTLHFTQSQTTNLISLKTIKTNIIRERINLKKNIIDFELKRSNKETEESVDTKLVNEILTQLNVLDTKKDKDIIYEDHMEDDVEENIDQALEEKLKDLQEQGAVHFNETELNVKNEHKGVLNIDINKVVSDLMNKQLEDKEKEEETTNVTVLINEETGEETLVDTVEEMEELIEQDNSPVDFNVSSEIANLLNSDVLIEENSDVAIVIGVNPNNQNDWNFYAVNGQYDIIEGYSKLPNKDETNITFKTINGELMAIDQNGEVYEVFDIEDDE